MNKKITSTLSLIGAALLFLGLQAPSKAQSVGINAFAGNNHQSSLQVQLDAWYTNSNVDSASFFYLYDGAMDCEGTIDRLTFHQDKDGTKHCVAQGWGFYYGAGIPVLVEVDTISKPDGSSQVAVKIADYFTGTPLYAADPMAVLEGVAAVDMTP